jgi:hypothetical protein
MSKKTEYKLEIPLFTNEATALWKDMPNIINDIVSKKQEAIEKFNRLDTLVNGGELILVGTAFGEHLYARINANDPDEAKYKAARLSKLMGNFTASVPEEIVLDGKRYTIVLKEQL